MPSVDDPSVERLVRAEQGVDGGALGLCGPIEHETEIH
jgi:hypothetical protein